MGYRKQQQFGDDKPEWNMALAYLRRLDNRLNEMEMAKNEGDLLGLYRCCRTVFCNIYWKVREPGQEENEDLLEELFKKAKVNFEMFAKDRNDSLFLNKFEQVLDEIVRLLNTLIMDYELVFVEKKVKPYDVVIEEEFD